MDQSTIIYNYENYGNSCASRLELDSESEQTDQASTSAADTANNNQLIKNDDPLSEPIVRLSLEKVQISSTQLINMSVKELNKRLSSCPAFIVAKLKRCRRTLKNRGYAKNCRVKRMAAKTHLEQQNEKLVSENNELRRHNRSLLEQLNQLHKARINMNDSRQLMQVIDNNNNNSNNQVANNSMRNYTYSDQYNPTYACTCSDDTYNQLLEPELDQLVATIVSDLSSPIEWSSIKSY